MKDDEDGLRVLVGYKLHMGIWKDARVLKIPKDKDNILESGESLVGDNAKQV